MRSRAPYDRGAVVSLSLLFVLSATGSSTWPPPTPAVELPGDIEVRTQLSPRAVAPSKGVCATESHSIVNNTCQIVRVDGGDSGFNIIVGSGQTCGVATQPVPEQDRRWVFDERGRLRREFTLDKKTAKSGGQVFAYNDKRIAKIERWSDFTSGKADAIETFLYDKDGRVVETTRQSGATAAERFVHVWLEGKIRMTTQTGTGRTWTYEYKGKQLIEVSERPGGIDPIKSRLFKYDSKGRVSAEENRLGPVRVAYTGWTYDKKGRLISEAIDDQGRPQLNLEAMAGKPEAKTVIIPKRADGTWDRVTRYYYDCDWIVRTAPVQAAPQTPAQPSPRKRRGKR